jgi:hypothetical protein
VPERTVEANGVALCTESFEVIAGAILDHTGAGAD